MKAIISDIHGNIDALRVVLSDIRAQGADEIYCLGDVIGYGAAPADCLDECFKFGFTLMGNHDWAVVNKPIGFNQYATEAVEWTRKQLKPAWYSSSHVKRRWRFLCGLPQRHTEGRMLFVHASPRNPIEEYLLRSDVDEVMGELSPKLVAAFEMTPWVCFVGHTHVPGVFMEDATFKAPTDIDMNMELVEGNKYIINVGSVGQPRDGDPRSCYLLLDGSRITYRRLDYPIEVAAKRIREAGLHEKLASRLSEGL